MMSLLMSLLLSFIPRDVSDAIWDIAGSVSEGFPTYFPIFYIYLNVTFYFKGWKKSMEAPDNVDPCIKWI